MALENHNHVFKLCLFPDLERADFDRQSFQYTWLNSYFFKFASRIFKYLVQRYLRDTSSSCNKSRKFLTTLRDLRCFTSLKIPPISYKSQVLLHSTKDRLYPVGRLHFFNFGELTETATLILYEPEEARKSLGKNYPSHQKHT